MNFQFTPSQMALRDKACWFAENELKPMAAKWDEEELFPKPMVARAAELGFLGLTIPKEYGGGGAGPIESILVIEELAKGCANTAEVVFDCIIGPIQVIAHHGTTEQKAAILPKAARGEFLMGIAISESHAGSGATDMLSRARIEGNSIVLNGHKAFVEDTSSMTSFLVYTKFSDAPGAKGIGGVIVEKGRSGFRIGPPRKKMGVRGCIQADLYFEDCRVPAENLVVGPGEFSKLMAAFNLERCGNAAMALGIAGAALAEAIAYAKKRTQFGRPLCEFQGLQWKLARLAMRLDAARLLTYRAVANGAQGFPSMLEASMAKAYANEMAVTVTNEALQIFGGLGYLRECPLERMVRDARAWSIAGGTVEIQLNNIASELFGRRFSQRPPLEATKGQRIGVARD
ncbi:MAG TPA: acyl-CoA dehydrogenase family protein [Alphaproteobacteria bacterium]|nr:acyl-CoA dehydrogenase family protein [Alphaproteobacteria bacterium]